MIKAEDFLSELKKYGLGPFVEVPCSILTPIINATLEDTDIELITPVNEGIAMGIASGAYMASDKIPVVLMQNSGFNNSTNALTSLNRIYDIPILYIITWRGFPGEKDAPEHNIMGADLEKILKEYKVPYKILNEENYKEDIGFIVEKIKKTKQPAALILKKGVIAEYERKLKEADYKLSGYKALKIIKQKIKNDGCIFISTNGFISRDSLDVKDTPDFYMIGSMGHALPIAIGVSKYTNKKVIVLDGDGGCLMHLGAMASVAKENPKNLIHFVLDNQCYMSTGGQPTISKEIDFMKYAEASGYRNIIKAENEEELKRSIDKVLKERGPSFVHILLNNKKIGSSRRVSDKYTCQEIKKRFMEAIKK